MLISDHLYVGDCLTAVLVLSQQDLGSLESKSGDPAYSLASQMMAYRLNQAAGAPVCDASIGVAKSAASLLNRIEFSGTGDILGDDGDDESAVTLAGQLTMYNNGLLCASSP